MQPGGQAMGQKEDKDTGKLVQEQVEQAVEGAQREVQQSRQPWYRVSRRAQILIGVYLGLFLLFAALTLFVRSNPVWSVDVAITREAQEEQAPWFRWLMLAISWLGNSGQTWLFVGLIGLT